MAPKTYTPVQSDYKFMEIIEYFFKQDGPVTGAQVAKDLGMKHSSVMSHLTPAIDWKWVKVTNGMYEPGIRIAAMYSVYKMNTLRQLEAKQGEYDQLEA